MMAIVTLVTVSAGLAQAQDDDPDFFDPGMFMEEMENGQVTAPQQQQPPPQPIEIPAEPQLPPEPAQLPQQQFVEEYYEEPPMPQPQPQPAVRPATRPPARIAPGTRPPVRPPSPRATSTSTTVPSSDPVIPNDEKTGETPTDLISFDFKDVPLDVVIERISRLTGRNFDVDPNIGATMVTIITHDKIPPEMAYEVLESILATRGFSMVETLDGHLIKIITTPDATLSEKVPLSKGPGPVPEGYDGYSTHIVPVKYADGAELSNVLKILGSKTARIDVYAPTNTLIITDTADGLRRMFAFLEDTDIPGFDTAMEIFTLEYTRAEALARQIEQVLLDTTGRSGAMAARTPQQAVVQAPTRAPVRPALRPVPGATSSQVIGSREEVLRMVPEERLNALIVVASDGMMERVRDLVKRLDIPTPYEANNLHIYELLNADAEQVESALQPLIGTAPRRTAAAGGGAGGAAPAQATEVQPFEQKVQVARYDQTNALLIVASPQDYKLLESFIARLDVPPRQVLVEAVIMQVNMTNNFSLAVDAAAVQGRDGFGMTSTGTISGLVPSTPDVSSLTGKSNFNDLATVAKAASTLVAGPGLGSIMGLGAGGGMTAGVFDDIEWDLGDGQKVKLPFVPLLFQAIEAVSDAEVLSQPSLVTVDNEEASIVVGNEVPFITSQQRGLTGTTTQQSVNPYYGYTRVQREDVGIKLTVTPQISEGDNVLLQMEIEDSSIVNIPVAQGGVDPNIAGPTTAKSQIKNKILVKDGSTAVIGGLIKDEKNRTRSQPPVFGDIPLIGWLFGKRSNNMTKKNLVVLVTPHIVKEGVDLDRVTQYKIGEYHDTNIDQLFERGFFKKIKKKRNLRKQHHPTFDRSEELLGLRETVRYGRGDIKR